MTHDYDLDTIRQMARDMEAVELFLDFTGAKLVGDEVHIKISKLAECVQEANKALNTTQIEKID